MCIRDSNNTGAPLACGGTVSVTFTVTSTCEPPVTCLATFAVTNATPVALICPANQTEPACQTQAAIDASFASWIASATFAGGCNAAISNKSGVGANVLGGCATVIFSRGAIIKPAVTAWHTGEDHGGW